MYDQCQGFNSLSPRHKILITPFNPKVMLKQSFKIYNPIEKEKNMTAIMQNSIQKRIWK